jgi:glycosyltransferase involved in cell wall biosynthesis
MRVVHVITRLIIGGAQENTLLTCEDQHRDYHDDVILVTGPAIGPEGSLMSRAEKAGFPIHLVDSMRRNINPLNEFKVAYELKSLLKKLNPQIIHTHSSKAGIIGRWAAAKLKIPCVHTIHGASFHYGQNPLAYGLYKYLEKWAAPKTTHFISVCDAMTDQYVAAGVAARDHFTTVYSGFHVEPFLKPVIDPQVTRQKYGIQPDHIVIGKIGRLFNLKGHDAILKVAPQIVAQCPQARFMFVGDGLLREQFKQQIVEMGLTDHFIFTGLVPPSQIPELIHAMDMVVHTSQWEGLARVLPQGLIAGKPVVTYDIDGAKEVCRHQLTGWLVPRNDYAQLTQAILFLCQHPDTRHDWGQTGRQLFTEQFKHETMTRRIREVYQKILGS